MTQKIILKSRKCLIILPFSHSRWERFLLKYLLSIFEANNLHCVYICYERGNERAQAEKIINLIAAEDQEFDFIFTLNRLPAKQIILNGGEIDLFSIATAPVVTWFIDNIGAHISSIPEEAFKQEIFLVADKCSIEASKKINHPVNENSFFPMWGPPAAENIEMYQTRDIPILFTGDLKQEETLKNLKDRIVGTDAMGRKVIGNTIERMVDSCGWRDCLDILLSETRDSGFSYEQALELFPPIDHWLRQRIRRINLRQFNSVPITICGEVEDAEISSRSNVKILGRKTIEEVLALATRSKVFLGDFANFVCGVEARPAMAFSSGCVFACYENKFFSKSFPRSSYIRLTSLDENSEDLILDVINNFELLNRIRDHGAYDYNSKLVNFLPFL